MSNQNQPALMASDVKFREYHNFKRINYYNEAVPSLSKPTNPNVAKWWCDKCDSVVQYPKWMSDHEVNSIIHTAGKFKCIEPVIKYKRD